jgi:hypothetical protein
MFSFSVFEYHIFYVLYPYVTYLLILPRRYPINGNVFLYLFCSALSISSPLTTHALTTVALSETAFLVASLYGLLNICQYFGRTYCFHLQGREVILAYKQAEPS